MTDQVSPGTGRAVYLVGDWVAETVDGCNCTPHMGAHKSGCGLELVGHLVTPEHDARVREGIAHRIAEVSSTFLNHKPCGRLNCLDCARRCLTERHIEIAQRGDPQP